MCRLMISMKEDMVDEQCEEDPCTTAMAPPHFSTMALGSPSLFRGSFLGMYRSEK